MTMQPRASDPSVTSAGDFTGAGGGRAILHATPSRLPSHGGMLIRSATSNSRITPEGMSQEQDPTGLTVISEQPDFEAVRGMTTEVSATDGCR
jgi:hypothetical protein